jgi:hypothetical protein
MSTTVSVPLSTSLADLDESLRALLRRELDRHGLDEVAIAFEAPSKEWSAAVSAPTLSLFLFDLREARERRPTDWRAENGNGVRRDIRPPLLLDASYAITAWTRMVEDEHRLLSQAIAILYAWPQLPADALAGSLAAGVGPGYPLTARVAQSREDGRADFWTAVGGQYKPSIDYTVTLPFQASSWLERGPETRSRAVSMRNMDGPRGAVEVRHRIAGVVRDEAGEPAADVWVVVDGRGWAATDEAGRFAFEGLPPGSYRVAARAADGREAAGELPVPGVAPDLTLGAAAAPAPPARRRRS